MKILSLAPLAGPAVEDLRALGSLEVDAWTDHVPIKLHSADELAERLRGVDVLLVEADHVSATVIETSALLAIGTCRGDPVNVDVAGATTRGIPVLRAPGRNARAVAELTIALAIAALRGIVAADDDVRSARWVVDGRLAQQRYVGRELGACTVGIVGYGAVGRAAAALYRAFGARVIVTDPYADAGDAAVPLDRLMAESDVISLHAALTDATRGMIGAAELGACKRGAVLVNTARFGLVDEAPLLAALQDGTLSAGAFDHFTGEFLAADHPLLTLPNVVLTPHIGGTTLETVAAHTRTMAAGLTALLHGETPPSLCNPEALGTFRARLDAVR